MKAIKMSKIVLSVVACIGLLGGCGGSSSNTRVEGKAIDDYISGGKVCIDSNNNGKCDEGETSTITDSNGRFYFPSKPKYPLILDCSASESECKDIATGNAFNGKLSAPAGSLVLNSLTTIIHEYSKNTGLSPEEVEKDLKEKLDLPEDIDLKTYDPIAESYDPVGQKVLAAQTQTQVLLNGISITTNAPTDIVAYSLAEEFLKKGEITTDSVKNVIENVISNTDTDSGGLGGTSVLDVDNVAETLVGFVEAVGEEATREEAAKVTKALDESSDEIVAGEEVDPQEVIENTEVNVDDVVPPATGAGSI